MLEGNTPKSPVTVWRTQRERYNLVGTNCPDCPPEKNKHLRHRPVCPDCGHRLSTRPSPPLPPADPDRSTASVTPAVNLEARTVEVDFRVESTRPLVATVVAAATEYLRQLTSALDSIQKNLPRLQQALSYFQTQPPKEPKTS